MAGLSLSGCSKANEPAPSEGELAVHDAVELDHQHHGLVVLETAQALDQAFASGKARYERDEPFEQVGFFYTAGSQTAEAERALDYRVRLTDGTWTEWAPIEVTWKENKVHVGRILLDEEAVELEVREDAALEWLQVEFFDEIVASTDVLTRDLPFAEPSDRVERGDYVTVGQALAPDFVVSRSAWGARNPGKICGSVVTPYRQAIHHTASPSSDGNIHSTMRGMQAYHIDNRGWCDIGYHFVVSQAGKVYQGRSRENRPGAHVGGENSGNVGTSLIGNFQSQSLSDTQLNAAAEIVGWVGRTYGIAFNRTRIKGHREHSGQTTSCPGNNAINRLDTLISRAEDGGGPAADYDISVEVKWLETENFYDQGPSASIADALPNDTFKAEILIKNKSNDVIRNVWAGFLVEEPYFTATNYTIYSDHPALDGQTWSVNSADSAEENPAKDQLGTTGKLNMHAFSAGETKRVLIEMKAKRYSIGVIDHPDVRGWIQHAEGTSSTIFGDRDSWGDAVETNELGHEARDYAQMDVLDRNAWLFDDASDEANLEGWTATPADHFEQLKVNASGMLAQKIIADDARIIAPAWTSVPTDKFDQLVVRVRSHDGPHTKAVFWAQGDESFAEERAVRFDASGDGEVHDLVIPLGSHEKWAGTVTKLRIDLLDAQAPAEDDNGWYDVDSIFFQNSADQTTSASGVDFSEGTVVELHDDSEDDDDDGGNNDPGGTNNDPGGTNNDPGGEPDDGGKNLTDGGDKVSVNDGCTATGTGGGPIGGVAWLLLIGAAAIARTRANSR
jgi:hypothetical protein